MGRILFAGILWGAVAWAQTRPAVTSPAEQSAEPKAAPAPSMKKAAAQTPEAAPAAKQPDTTPAAKQPNPTEIQSAMGESLAKQRVAAMAQVKAVMGKVPAPATSFFTVPWVETPVPFSQPPCDPVPAAQLDKLVLENSQQQGVKEDLIRGVIQQESGGRPCAVSWKGAQGLMQLMPATSEQLGVKDPFDPSQSVEAGTRLLKQLLTKYKNDTSLALAAYNAGEARVDQEGGVPQIPETRNYVDSIESKLPKN
jgi:soluble lytic murein transglycosylase-like protein